MREVEKSCGENWFWNAFKYLMKETWSARRARRVRERKCARLIPRRGGGAATGNEIIAGKIWYAKEGMEASAAAHADVNLEEHQVVHPKRDADAVALAEIGKIEIAGVKSDFAGIIEGVGTEIFPEAVVVFGLHEDGVGSAKLKILKAAESGIVVGVGAAKRGLQIKGDEMAGAGV